MSLGIAFKGSEGLVLAADSRVTIMGQAAMPGAPMPMLVAASYDNATKLLKVNGQKYVAAVTYGAGVIGATEPRTAHSLIPEFEAELGEMPRLPVKEFAQKLSNFFGKQWANTMPAGLPNNFQMLFIVAGFDDKEAYGRIFEFSIPGQPAPVEQNVNMFGIRFGGQNEVMARILNGCDDALLNLWKTKHSLTNAQLDEVRNEIAIASGAKVPYQFLPLQDCVDLSILMIQTTSQIQSYQTAVRGVGGSIDVATITRLKGFEYVQQKRIHGQSSGD